MTREELINHIKYNLEINADVFLTDEDARMVIKALEQEPCEDCISRQAVLDMMQMRISGKELYKAVYDLPPVTSQPKIGHWIPVSERLPEESGKYLVTFGGTYRVGIDFYSTEEDAIRDFEEPEEHIGWCSQNVIAWMSLPKPYKAESEV